MNLLLLGMVAMGCFVAALFFLRFWRDTRDRLFLLFGLSFALEGVNRVALGLSPDPSEGSPIFYVIRLASFLMILAAILDKNLSGGRR